MLSDAERPLILAGTGVHRSGASAALAALAERLPAPVVTTTAGKGAISDRSPLALGHALRAYAPLVEFAQSRDVVLAVGTQAGPAGLLGVDPDRVIRIDLDAGVGPPTRRWRSRRTPARPWRPWPDWYVPAARRIPPRPSRRSTACASATPSSSSRSAPTSRRCARPSPTTESWPTA